MPRQVLEARAASPLLQMPWAGEPVPNTMLVRPEFLRELALPCTRTCKFLRNGKAQMRIR